MNNNGSYYGYTYDGTTFHKVNIPGYPYTTADGVNNAGVIVGEATASGYIAYELSGSKFKDITPPPGGFISVYATGINNVNQVVGWSTGVATTGFEYRNGAYKTIKAPGDNTDLTEAWKINDQDIIVGWYDSCGDTCAYHGFAMRRGKYITLDFPGARDTFALGINDTGQIVGSYTVNGTTYHGFVTSPISAADFDRPGCCLVDPNWKEE